MIQFEKITLGYEKSISVPVIQPEDGPFDVERFIFSLSHEQSQVIALRGLGFSTDEIMVILKIPSKGIYYKLIRSIQTLWKENKKLEIGV